MSGKKAKQLRAAAKLAPGPGRPNRATKALPIATLIILVAAISAGYFIFSRDRSTKPAIASSVMPAEVVRKAQTLNDLLKIPAGRLGEVDIAEMNLLCAAGLPGAEKLDIDHALATLDDWARRVAIETDRHLYRVADQRYAEHYRHNEAYFRAEMLLQVLQQDLGVKYNMAAKDNFAFTDSRVAFIHGMIPAPGQTTADTPGGTCASMPVMYVAVGRRLGYPLKLVTTKGHVFVRWEGKEHFNTAWRDRFNIEGSGEGFSSFDDDHYKTWPFKLTDAEIKANGWLQSLTPREEFAEFLAARGHCGMDNGQPLFAASCYENSSGYDPTRPCYRTWLLRAAMQSGYRPVMPALIALLEQRKQPGVDPEQFVAQQRADALARMRQGNGDGSTPGGLPPATPIPASADSPYVRVGQWEHQPPTPGVPQSPPPNVSKPPQVGVPQSAGPNPYQTYQPPMVGQTPR